MCLALFSFFYLPIRYLGINFLLGTVVLDEVPKSARLDIFAHEDDVLREGGK